MPSFIQPLQAAGDCKRAVLPRGSCTAIAIIASILASTVFPASAKAPSVAPLPPQRASAVALGASGEQIDTDRKIDATQAREMLMQQLLKAAEAGIVNLEQPAEEAKPVERKDDAPAENEATEAETVIADDGSSVVATPESNTEPDEPPVPESTNAASTAEPSDTQIKEQEVAALAQRLKNGRVDPTIESENAVNAPEDQSPIADDTSASARCFSREELTLPDVLQGHHLAASIGEQRKALLGEFDAANIEPAIALAKTYLSVGMVHEARTVINEFAGQDPLGEFFLNIASIWMGEEAEINGSLFKEDCIGVQALWRAFAQARLGRNEIALRSEVSSGASLEELPLHARQVVAAELGLIAAEQGQWDSARRLSAMAIRAADGEGSTLGDTHLLSYRLAKWRDDAGESKKYLALASGSDTDTATEALLIRAQEALRSDDVLDPDHAALRMDLGALARREIGSELAQRAFEFEARLFHRSAGSDETIGFLSDAVELGLLDPNRHASFLSELISKPAFSDASRPLAHIYLDDPDRFDEALEQPSLRRSLIRSLAGQGVPGIAATLVREGDIEDAGLAVELAESFVEIGEYRDAIATLSKADDGIAQRLILSKAFLAMGDFEKAISILENVPKNIPSTPQELNQIATARLEAELAGKDYASALTTAVSRLPEDNDRNLAEQSALIALETGAAGIPDAARAVLSSKSVDDLANLEEMFSLNQGKLLEDNEDIEGLFQQLKEIEASETLIREILENG